MVSKIISTLDYIQDIREEVIKNVYDSIIPLYHRESNELIGTSFLLKYDKKYFLFTAKHILKEYGVENICVYFKTKGTIFRPSTIYRNTTYHHFGQRDNLDIAIFMLTKESINGILTHFNSIDIEKIQYNHVLVDGDYYMLFGFPQEWNKDIYNQKRFIYHGIPLIKLDYKEFGYKKHYHIILNYDPNNIIDLKSNESITGPNLNCLSGSPLIYIPFQLRSKQQKAYYFLVGMLIEYVQDKNIIGFTRIDCITEYLRQVFKLDLPKTQLFELNITKKESST